MEQTEQWKLLVVFDYSNGEQTMAEYDRLKDIAESHGKDVDYLLDRLCVDLGAYSYSIVSSRLLS